MIEGNLQAKKTESAIAIIALFFLAAGCIIVLRPFFSALLWAMLLCFSTWPAFGWVTAAFGGRRSLAALTMILGLAAIVVVPFVIVGASLADNVRDVVAAIHKVAQQGPSPAPEWLGRIPLIGSHLAAFWYQMSTDSAARADELHKLIEPLQWIALKGGAALGHGILQISLSLLIAFFLFRDGAAAVKRLTSIVDQIAGARGGHLLHVASVTVKGVVYGVLGTSLLQGLMAGIGFWIAGVPGAFLLGFGTFLLSFLPSGPALLWLPAAAWLYKQGFTGWAVFMILWGLIPVGMIDHVLKPILISRTGGTPLILIMLGVLGGAVAFGFIGVFIGPTLLAIGWSLVQEWNAGPSSQDEKSTVAGGAAG